MFYNGTSTLVVIIIIYVHICDYMYNLTIYSLSPLLKNTSMNDGIIFLNVISSPVYTLLFFIITVIILNTSSKLTKQQLNAIFFFLLYQFYFYYDGFNNTLTLHKLMQAKPNTNLYNGLLNLHPYVIYIAYGYLILNLLNTFLITNTCKYNFFSKQKNYFSTINVIISIILGAWWASQELNWGGFWSWDPVELISILIAIIFLWKIHKNYNPYITLLITNILIIISIIYLIMRLGVATTIHSFIKTTHISFIVYLSFLFTLLNVAITILKNYIYNYTDFIKNYKTKKIYITIKLYKYSLVATVVFLILLSFDIKLYNKLPQLNTIYFVITQYILCYSPIYLSSIQLIYNYITLSYFINNSILLNYILLLLFSSWLNRKFTLHFIFIWLILLFTIFFTPIINTLKVQYCSLFDICITDNQIIQHYTNNTGIFCKLNKSFYNFNLKNYYTNILDFYIHSNFIDSQNVLNKKTQKLFMYSYEYLYTLLYTFIFICIYISFEHKYKTNINIY